MNAPAPIISVVVPTYNRAQLLRRLLDSLALQVDPATPFEVLVVIDGSTDNTQAMLASLTPPFPLRVASQPNAGAGAARNHGVRLAQADWVIFLDDDMQVEPGFMAAYLAAARLHGPAVLLGQVVTRLAPGADWYAHQFGREWAEQYATLNAGLHTPSWQDCYSGNLAVSREALQRAGGWHEDLARNEDLELGYRLQKLGLRFVYVPGALAIQWLDKGFRALIRDVTRAGPASVAMLRRHPELPSQLGRFGETTGLDIAARQALLALRVPLRPLDWIGRLIGNPERAWQWYRFVYSYAYWRAVRSALTSVEWQRLTSGTVILMYHALARPGERTGRYLLPARVFGWQMAWLKHMAYNVISLDDYVDYRRRHSPPPPRSVVITLDDGYQDNYTLALPTLRRYGFPATVFLVSDYVGRTNEWDHALGTEVAGRPLLTREQILDMRAQAITFGVHTRTHPSLISLPVGEQRAEIFEARAELERRFGFPFNLFSYPYGDASDDTRALVAEAGFAAAVGIHMQKNYPSTPLVELRRVEIRGTYGLLDFITSVWLGGHRE